MQKKKILIIDDEKAFTTMLKLNLELTGLYEVATENDPVNALASALKSSPDLILLDVIMPNVDGPDIAFQIKNYPLLKGIPIVFLTATVRKEEVKSGGMIAGHCFVAKTDSLSSLFDTIENEIILSAHHPHSNGQQG